MTLSRRRRLGFTLLELAVVVAILSILTALLLPAIQRSRLIAQRTMCQNHLKNQALAVHGYEAAFGRLPPGAIQGPFLGVPADVSHGLYSSLLPYLDQAHLADQYRWDISFDDAENQTVVRTRLHVLQCPASDAPRFEIWDVDENNNPTRYGGSADYGPVEVNKFLIGSEMLPDGADTRGVLEVNGVAQLSDIADGTSATILLVETSHSFAWASPLTMTTIRGFIGAGRHPGGVNVVMADGSARILSPSIDPAVVAKMVTRAGGENVGDDSH